MTDRPTPRALEPDELRDQIAEVLHGFSGCDQPHPADWRDRLFADVIMDVLRRYGVTAPRSEVERLRDELDVEREAGVILGEDYKQARAALDRVRALAEQWEAFGGGVSQECAHLLRTALDGGA